MARVRRTVRMRLTILYSGLFVVGAIVLLGITNGVGSTSSVAVTATGAQDGSQPLPPAVVGGPEVSLSHGYVVGSFIALVVMAVASVVIGWLAAGRVLRPLRVMTQATRRISADSLHERLAMQGPADELRELSDTIDDLLERLDGAFAAQRRFVANASHELRTPLATARALVDVAAAKPGPPPPETLALASRVRAELDKVDVLLDGLLALARGQHGALPETTSVAVDDAVSAALTAHADEIEAHGLTVRRASARDSRVVASEPLLRRLVDNLLDNAVRHNTDGGWIAVATDGDPDMVRLIVENGGAVLDPAAVAELAQPFRRLGTERTGSPAGAGLGLSIVTAIAEAHGGTVDLRARTDGGLAVAVALPRAPAIASTRREAAA
jgi:signal transduction histidine kinase